VAKNIANHTMHFQKSNIELHVAFQPICNLGDSGEYRILGYEAFTRATVCEKRIGIVSLLQWAKNEGLLSALEKNMCHVILAKSRSLIQNGDMLFLNMEPATFFSFMDGEAESVFNGFAANVVIEITEHDMCYDTTAKSAVAEWRKLGVRLAIDDVASGYDRLKHILYLVPDFIKLNRELISDCEKEPRHRVMISGLTEMGKALGASTIAEGVENVKELNTWKTLGIPAAQGYYFCKPATAEKLVSQQRKGVIRKKHNNTNTTKGDGAVVQDCR